MTLAPSPRGRYDARVLRRLALASLVALAGCKSADDAPVRVGAAAGVARAFEALSKAQHLDAKYSFAATGLLAKQLEQGAPFDVFVSADTAFVDQVVKASACDGATQRTWAVGRVAVVTRQGVALPGSLAELADPRFTRIALGNPETAPYGRAAKEALERAGLYDAVKTRLVPAENVLQALQFVDSGNAEAGLVARSLLPPERPALLVDAALHAPVELGVVLCAKPERRAKAQAFVDALTSPEAAALLAGFGYEAPGGPPK